ncbi:unnamed protein product [Meloidogyne enterolobii]|uniref:Uncharacterized protein n=1 Tax=Meloidogyne enterolobii TaxID=390850 RepID=A0ACB1AM22_MELEN
MLDKILDLRQKMGSQYTMNTEWIRANHPIFAYDVSLIMSISLIMLIFQTVYMFSNISPFSFLLYKFTTLEISTPTTGKYARDQTISLYQFVLHSSKITDGSINGMRLILTELSQKHPQEMASILPSGLPEREAIEKWISNIIQVNEKFSEIMGNFV